MELGTVTSQRPLPLGNADEECWKDFVWNFPGSIPLCKSVFHGTSMIIIALNQIRSRMESLEWKQGAKPGNFTEIPSRRPTLLIL
jgi:hypothetical protein